MQARGLNEVPVERYQGQVVTYGGCRDEMICRIAVRKDQLVNGLYDLKIQRSFAKRYFLQRFFDPLPCRAFDVQSTFLDQKPCFPERNRRKPKPTCRVFQGITKRTWQVS